MESSSEQEVRTPVIFHSIIPVEDVMKGAEDFKQEYVDIVSGGVQMQVSPVGLGQGKIVRLLSTDPQDYLKPGLQPGSLVSWPVKTENGI